MGGSHTLPSRLLETEEAIFNLHRAFSLSTARGSIEAMKNSPVSKVAATTSAASANVQLGLLEDALEPGEIHDRVSTES